MKIITKKQQKQIDEENIKRLTFALIIGHKKKDLKPTNEEFKIMAEDIYNADAIIV